MSEDKEIELPEIARCETLGQLPTIWQNSRCCVTVECPDGMTGSPVERCVEAGRFYSSNSQQEANDLACTEATRLATEALVCLNIEGHEEETALDITLLGAYASAGLAENAALAIALLGEYALAPHEDEALLAMSVSGANTLIPFLEHAGLNISLYPLSEYRIIPFTELPSLKLSVSGDYASTTVPNATIAERPSLALTVSGSYDARVIATAKQENAALALSVSGTYTSLVTPAPPKTDTAGLAISVSGASVYQFAVIPAPYDGQRNDLSITLGPSSYS